MAKPQYGAAHRRERKRWRLLVDEGQVNCCLCGKWLAPGSPFDLDHLPGTTDQYRGAACVRCNRVDGGKRRHIEPTPRRWIL